MTCQGGTVSSLTGFLPCTSGVLASPFPSCGKGPDSLDQLSAELLLWPGHRGGCLLEPRGHGAPSLHMRAGGMAAEALA